MSPGLSKGWQRLELGDLVALKSGGTPNRATPEFWGGEMPWISAKDLKSFDLVDSIERLTPSGTAKLNTVPAGTILILVRGMGLFKDFPIGITSRLMTFNQDVKALIPKSTVNARFLAYALLTRRGAVMGRIDTAGHGTGRLSTEYLVALPIAIPPLSEQRRIVAVLDSWNRAIDQTEQLIAAKRQRFDTLIKSIFASARDLSVDPPGGWHQKPIGALAHVVGGGTPDTTNVMLWNGSVLWCTPTDITSLSTRHIATTARTLSDAGLRSSSATLLPEGSVVLCSRASVGICAIATAPMSTNQGFQSLVPQAGSDPHFLYYLARACERRIIRMAAGSTFLEISGRELGKLVVTAPGAIEQQRIGRQFAVLDDDIDLLVKQLDVLRIQKLGLMQKLLTGEWRLGGRFDPVASDCQPKLAEGSA